MCPTLISYLLFVVFAFALLAAGILLYPEDPAAPGTPPAEAGSPWVLADGTAVSFAALPAGVDAAAAKLRGIVRLTSRSSLNGRLAACG